MSKYAHIVDNIVDNLIICDDSNIYSLPGFYVKATEERGMPKIGSTYDVVKDKFIEVKPYESWVLNEENIWESPDGFSSKEGFWWDEESQEWVALITATE
jgi:hypothetical protein